MTTPMSMTGAKVDTAGAWAVVIGAAVWGVYWIPLRYLEQAGIPGLWAVALVMGAAFIPALIVTMRQRELSELASFNGWVVGIALGVASVLYFTAVLYTDVIRAIFLFYLLPLWTTLSARIVYGERIRRAQLWVIGAAVLGVWLLLGGGFGFPIPNNVGDWCAIASGFCWGVSLSLLRSKQDTPAFATTAATLFSGFVLASLCAVLLHMLAGTGTVATTSASAGEAADITNAMLQQPIDFMKTVPLAAAFGAAVLFPSMLGQIWGARRIPAPTAALLTMTEIIVATTSAGLLVGTDLTPISILGGIIIIVAVCMDLTSKRNQID